MGVFMKWITREIVLLDYYLASQDIVDCVDDALNKEIIPFVDRLIDTDKLINYYTSFTAHNENELPHYRIYVRVLEEDAAVIENMFSEFIQNIDGLYYTDQNPYPPTGLSDVEIASIQTGSYHGRHIRKLFPYKEDRGGKLFPIFLLRELLLPIGLGDPRMLHFLVVNLGGVDKDYVLFFKRMSVWYKKIVNYYWLDRFYIRKIKNWFRKLLNRSG